MKCTCAELKTRQVKSAAGNLQLFKGHFAAGTACILVGALPSFTQLCIPHFDNRHLEVFARFGHSEVQSLHHPFTPAFTEGSRSASEEHSCTNAEHTGREPLDLVFDHCGLMELIVGFASHAQKKKAKPSWKPKCLRKESVSPERVMHQFQPIYMYMYTCVNTAVITKRYLYSVHLHVTYPV